MGSISKGKAHKQYEFGCKVALMIVHKKGKGLILGSHAIHGNPYDWHTLKASIAQTQRITAVKVQEAYLDRGYKGHGVEDVQTFVSGQKHGIGKARSSKIKRRSAIELHIGHMKNTRKLALCRLKGMLGDQLNAILAAAGYNLKLILNYLRDFYTQIWIQFLNFITIKILQAFWFLSKIYTKNSCSVSTK
jgi:IS5 family transposase